MSGIKGRVTSADVAKYRKVADVVDPNTNQSVVQDPTERDMVHGAQKHGPKLGGRPDLDISPFLNRDKAATGRVIEPKSHTDANVIDELGKKPLRRGI